MPLSIHPHDKDRGIKGGRRPEAQAGFWQHLHLVPQLLNATTIIQQGIVLKSTFSDQCVYQFECKTGAKFNEGILRSIRQNSDHDLLL